MEEDGGTLRTEARAKKRRKINNKKKKRRNQTTQTPSAASVKQISQFDALLAKPPSDEGRAGANTGANPMRSACKKRQRQSPASEEGVMKVSQLKHPFPTDYCDHFETPLQAYRDIEEALAALAKRLGKKRQHLRIWDPYYCAGRTPRLLARLGFPRVEHHNEDFYKVVEKGKQPPHDVLVTNPPYSGDHKKRCLEYCRASGKPWFLLIPNYVATKDYYKLSVLGAAAGLGGEPFYVVPDTKYPFDHPEGTGHADSPFFAVWFAHCGRHNEEIFQATKRENKGRVGVVRSLEELAERGAVKTERRLNPRQRKAIKKKFKLGGAGASGGTGRAKSG